VFKNNGQGSADLEIYTREVAQAEVRMMKK
jgi:hypothetical protein